MILFMVTGLCPTQDGIHGDGSVQWLIASYEGRYEMTI